MPYNGHRATSDGPVRLAPRASQSPSPACLVPRKARRPHATTPLGANLAPGAPRRTIPLAGRSPVHTIASLLRPNTTLLGYALFLAINAASVWGGVFPFLPVAFQTSDILLAFFLSQSLVYTASFFASVLGVYFFPRFTRRFIVLLPAAPYFAGWCFLIAAIYLSDISTPLVIVGGALLGLGSAGFYMLWQRLYASQEADESNRNLIVGTVFSALLYFALYLIPQAVTAFLIPLAFLPLFGLSIVLRSREINLDQPMFEDVPREHPTVYRKALRAYFPSALSVGAVGFCCGIVRALAIDTPVIGSLVNIVSMSGSLVAGLALLAVWQKKNLRVNVLTVYRFLFPLLITAFLVMPLAGTAFSAGFAALLYAAYSVGIMLMMMQCAQATRNDGINPVFIYGFFGGIVYLLHDIGFLAGTFSDQLNPFGGSAFASAAIVAIYLLGIMYFVGHGGFRTTLNPERASAGNIELVALNAPTSVPHAVSNAEESEPIEFDLSSEATPQEQEPVGAAPAIAVAPAPTADRALDHQTPEQTHVDHDANVAEGPQYRDRVSKQCALVQQNFRLSNRETEVMELLVRGNTVAHIAEELVVAENTIRTHSKRIYAKLAVHKRQELIDLVTLFSPADLPE